ncbi:MAG: rod shape-determining protein MreD [Candidatus Azotimanducaceae bacterium]
MTEAVAKNRLGAVVVIWVTFIFGMVLSVVPLPDFIPGELGYLRPDWVAMVLVYWIIALPHRVGILSAWVAGIVVDVLLGSLLGQHALAYVVIAYVAMNLYQRMRMFSVWQQALIVFAMLGLNQLINLWIDSIAGLSDWSLWYLLPALSGAFLWPWAFLILRGLRRRMGIS